MDPLASTDFSAFMREVTGFDPFPWQSRLLEAVVAPADTPGWPSLLDLPTGTGKTSALHVATFAMALRPDLMPRRIVLVVDRRVIVDQVFGVAGRLAAALEAATGGITKAVADRLRACSATPGSAPLRATLMRGGVPRDDEWIRSPDQPTVFASTVDQVGSRLLFRGYGVSAGMRPIHAGVLGTDTLYLLDEVHLATAFEQTLSDLAMFASPKWREYEGGMGRPIRVVRMSATPRAGSENGTTFGLSDPDLQHPVLRKRLEASRPARLELVKTKAARTPEAKHDNRQLLAKAACTRAVQAAESGARVIGLVMNRVANAVAVATELERRKLGPVLLLTGRMRPFDRAEVQRAVEAAASAGGPGGTQETPTFVVATSCIEAGADYDFDALITEVASLPALRQRFGRLNRLGQHDDVKAWVLGSKDQLSDSAKPDPIYGPALANTWAFLERSAVDEVVDFGLTRFPAVDPELLETLRVENVPPPVMFPNYLDLWSETRPAPHPDPDVSLWMHGKDRDVDRDVSIVFRVDAPTKPGVQLEEHVIETLDFIPPTADEAVSVPHEAASKYFRRRSDQDDPRLVRWTAEGAETVKLSSVAPGDVLVAPASWGGLTKGTWDPSNPAPVPDLAERVYAGRADGGEGAWVLRLTESVVGTEVNVPRPPDASAREDLEAWEQAGEQLDAWLAQARTPALPAWLSMLLDSVEERSLSAQREPAGPNGERWHLRWMDAKRGVRASTDDAVSSFTGVEVSLRTHLDDVRAWAASFGQAAGISPQLAEDVSLAAWLHDIGKGDLRFQVLLRGGDPIAAQHGEPLAKSKALGARARRDAGLRSGWPSGFRHELVSLALLDASVALQGRAHDLDLVRHLVASHHGWCRPWSPALDDPSPTHVRVQLGDDVLEANTAAVDDALRLDCAARFRRLNRRYGWHGLAYLESLLRLGDHQASRTPMMRPECPTKDR